MWKQSKRYGHLAKVTYFKSSDAGFTVSRLDFEAETLNLRATLPLSAGSLTPEGFNFVLS